MPSGAGERWVATALSGSLFMMSPWMNRCRPLPLTGDYCPPYHEANEWFVDAVRG